MARRTLAEALDRWGARAATTASEAGIAARTRHDGSVERVGDGVAFVSGAMDAGLDELLAIENGGFAMAVRLEENGIGCVLLGGEAMPRASARVRATGGVVRVPVGDALLGRVVDPLGRPLDAGATLDAAGFEPAERAAPAIIDRDAVTTPLSTGLTVVDAMLPIGRGQRELIIGDRSTGKTALAVDTILRQRSTAVICVYVAIGQKAAAIQRVIDAVREYGPFDRSLFVIAEADSMAGLQWLAPFAACTMAEWWVTRGRDVLIVLDDLTKHASVHRQLSLLLRAPPGREAYPGDVFYLHARLLERAARYSSRRGGGSLTALPIAETQGGNLTAYVPTNLISITDGQIYLSPKLFNAGQLPAVDVGRSVSRVGGKAQSAVLKPLAESLKLEYAQFLELESFARFGASVDERTRKNLEHGRRTRAALSQRQYAPLSQAEQVALLLALDGGLLDAVAVEQVAPFRDRVRAWLAGPGAAIAVRLDSREPLNAVEREELRVALRALGTEPEQAGDRDGTGG